MRDELQEESLGHIQLTQRIHFFNEVTVSSQDSEWSCTLVLGVSILPLSMNLTLDFGIAPIVWYFVENADEMHQI